ncbi:MAG: uracil-DNA glycosylase [Mesorhizobium sp.]
MYLEAVDDFLRDAHRSGWARLPFFASGAAADVARRVDARRKDGANVLPPAADVFNALRLVSPDQARVFILGQDPYPTPGHAHGLAFSYAGAGALPASLRNIFKEIASDLGQPLRRRGDLSDWAQQGVLLLNSVLTVEERSVGAHLKLGWQALADQAVAAVSATSPACVFILWGAKAAASAPLVDRSRHLVLTSVHPSPLSAHNGFFGSRPFSKANAWLMERGARPIDWTGQAS